MNFQEGDRFYNFVFSYLGHLFPLLKSVMLFTWRPSYLHLQGLTLLFWLSSSSVDFCLAPHEPHRARSILCLLSVPTPWLIPVKQIIRLWVFSIFRPPSPPLARNEKGSSFTRIPTSSSDQRTAVSLPLLLCKIIMFVMWWINSAWPFLLLASSGSGSRIGSFLSLRYNNLVYVCIYFMGKVLCHSLNKDMTRDASSIFHFVFLGKGFYFAHCSSHDVMHSFLNRCAISARGQLAYIMPWDAWFDPVTNWVFIPYNGWWYSEHMAGTSVAHGYVSHCYLDHVKISPCVFTCSLVLHCHFIGQGIVCAAS